jgi:hypothetical protein
MPRDPAIRSSVVEAMNRDGVVARDEGGDVFQENADPNVVATLFIHVDPAWLSAAAHVGIGAAGYVGAKFIDGLAGDMIKDAGTEVRQRVAGVGRAMFRNLGNAVRRLRRGPSRRLAVTLSAMAASSETRQYYVPAVDAIPAVTAIADDLLEPNQPFRQRHWVEGRWIDGSSYLQGDARAQAKKLRTLPLAEFALDPVIGKCMTYGPFAFRSVDGLSDILVEIPLGIDVKAADDLLDALRGKFPQSRIGLDDSNKHIRITAAR